MVPSPHKEGLATWAGKMSDRIAFLAFQQADTVFCLSRFDTFSVGAVNTWDKVRQCRVYYNGHYPQVVFHFVHDRASSLPLGCSATYAVTINNVDLGTCIVSTPTATACAWFVDIPAALDAGEHTFQWWMRSDDDDDWYWARCAGLSMTWLPVRMTT
jgi:hypothetical protein